MTIYIVDLESIPTRYTCEWKTHVPELIKQPGYKVKVIEGPITSSNTTPGMFLNFAATNAYKAAQVKKISELFAKGKVEHDDYFLFTDAWHPGVINLRYMADLFGIKIKIGGLFHAGSWDPHDALGRSIGDAAWIRHAEKSFFNCFDNNFFASKYHINLFYNTLLKDEYKLEELLESKKIVQTGWPMEYMEQTLAPYKNIAKKDLILFPHRIAPEKQIEIFNDLKHQLPQYEFVVCQKQNLSKQEYHTLLGQAKIVFSASLQETLGISVCAEAPLTNTVPFAPDRLSYTEIFKNHSYFLYPSKYTESIDSYYRHRDWLKSKIVDAMNNYNDSLPIINEYIETQYQKFFNADKLLGIVTPCRL